MSSKIAVDADVPASLEAAWQAYTVPDAIAQWNFASPDWCCPLAQVDLRARWWRPQRPDGSARWLMGFDLEGVYEQVNAPNALTLRLSDGRAARTTFEIEAGGTRVRTVFDPETENPAEMQRDGWQAILDSYARYVRGGTT